MRILITGICGFAGSVLAEGLQQANSSLELFGVDNFIRPGSELNRRRLQQRGIKVMHADIRNSEDFASIPSADWVIDAAANPTVVAGIPGSGTSSRQLMQHNLAGTVNVLEFCREKKAGLILLSTSRVYSVTALRQIQVQERSGAFQPMEMQPFPPGFSLQGISEDFSTRPPISLYGATKACAETLALEYSHAFNFPVWVNRLGVLAGAGQFGRADQGIFSFWIHSCAAKRPLQFIGFGGGGYQVRDCLHPLDLVEVILCQTRKTPQAGQSITNFSGGLGNSLSLRQLDNWCAQRFGAHNVAAESQERNFDVPWLVLDSARAKQRFGWEVKTPLPAIFEEIADHALANPNWLELTS